jgi:hypothetical protein
MHVTAKQLLEIRGRAMARWHSIPAEAMLPGSAEFLTADQRITISWLEACAEFLHARAGGPNLEVDLDIGIEDEVG